MISLHRTSLDTNYVKSYLICYIKSTCGYMGIHMSVVLVYNFRDALGVGGFIEKSWAQQILSLQHNNN